jgi:dUTPase
MKRLLIIIKPEGRHCIKTKISSDVDGDVLQIRDRDQIRLQDKIILTNGTTVNPDGTFQK